MCFCFCGDVFCDFSFERVVFVYRVFEDVGIVFCVCVNDVSGRREYCWIVLLIM